jgi:hypothetical protein
MGFARAACSQGTKIRSENTRRKWERERLHSGNFDGKTEIRLQLADYLSDKDKSS